MLGGKKITLKHMYSRCELIYFNVIAMQWFKPRMKSQRVIIHYKVALIFSVCEHRKTARIIDIVEKGPMPSELGKSGTGMGKKSHETEQ